MGTRAGLHGQVLISTGHADLDQHLNDTSWQKERRAGSQGFGHRARDRAACRSLPSRTPTARSRMRNALGSKDAAETEKAEPQLRIAWQYRRYIQRQQQQQEWGLATVNEATASVSRTTPMPDTKSGSAFTRKHAHPAPGVRSGGPAAKQWCHSFDLTQAMPEEQLHQAQLERLVLQGDDAAQRLAQAVLAFAEERPSIPSAQDAEACAGAAGVAMPRPGGPVRRIAVERLGAPGWGLGPSPQAAASHVLHIVHRLRAAVQQAPCAALVTFPTGCFPTSLAARMAHMCDGVAQVEAVRDNAALTWVVPDPTSVAALLRLRKLPGLNMLARPAPAVAELLIRHRRRRLALEAIDIDPDAEAALCGGGGTGPVGAPGRPASTGLCHGPPNAAKALDF